MKKEDEDRYYEQFENTLQRKIIIAISIIFLCLYLIDLSIQITKIYMYVNGLNKIQMAYLQSIGGGLADQKQYEYSRILNFLDSSNKIFASSSITYEPNSTCVNQMVFCNYSYGVHNYGLYYHAYPLLKANSQMLRTIEGVSLMFLATSSSKIIYNIDLGSLNDQKTQQIVMYIKNFNTTAQNDAYIFQNVMINSSFNIIVLCQEIKVANNVFSLCVVVESLVISSIRQNFYTLLTFDNYSGQNAVSTVFNNSSSSYSYYLSHFIDTLQVNVFRQNQVNSKQKILNCLLDYPNLYGLFVNFSNGLFISCKNDSNAINLFGPYNSFIYFNLELQNTIATKTYNKIYKFQKTHYTIIVSSNSTYYQNMGHAIQDQLIQIRYTSLLLISILALLILALTNSSKIISNTFLASINAILTACDLLKSKDEKDFHKSVAKDQAEILKFLIDYFQKFMWIYKVFKFKAKNRYKKLLLEGLQLFNEQDYSSVLEYTYRELIILEQNLIEKLCKIRQLPFKKKETMVSKFQQPIPERVMLPLVNTFERVSKRRNANMHLLDPDDDVLMKNISVSFRGNRGVRFSNEIQTVEIDEGPILRKAKFTQKSIQSCQTIKNDLSEENQSVKKIDENKDSSKSLKSEQESYTSLFEREGLKRDSSFKNKSLQSIHGDLENMKIEQFENESQMAEQQIEQDEIYNLSRQAIVTQIHQTYTKMIRYYQQLIGIKKKQLNNQGEGQLYERINEIYLLTIHKYEKIYDLLLYQQKMSIRNDQLNYLMADFQDFQQLEQFYNHHFRHQWLQKAEILKLSILQALHMPVSFKNLQFLSRANNRNIKIAARHLLALTAEQLQPHLDLVLVQSIYQNLKQQKTTSSMKQNDLTILINNLERYPNFNAELEDLKMARQFYNIKSKKFYFLVSISNIKAFTSILAIFYEGISTFDVINIFNLDEENSEIPEGETADHYVGKLKRRTANDKIKYLLDLSTFVNLFNFNNSDRLRESHEKYINSSVKTINKKRIYQREFHELLTSIESDEVDFSKFLIIFLGDQQSSSSAQTDQSSSNANHRPYQQKIHLEITRIIERGYFHIIMVGNQLNYYPSKYGRIKKYVKLSPQLLEIDLSIKDHQQNYKKILRYIR